MIVKMKKITFIGLEAEKEAFVARLQEEGVTHVTLPAEAVEPSEVARELQKVTEIRKFLARLGKGAGRVTGEAGGYGEVCAKREAMGQRETRLIGEVSILKKERALLEPWGDFEPGDIALLQAQGLDVRFYRVSRKLFEEMNLENVYCHVCNETQTAVTFVAVSMEPLDLGAAEEKLPARSLSSIDREIAEKTEELAGIKEAYQALAKEIETLLAAEVTLKDDYEYRKVLLNTTPELEDRLFVLTCWSPVPLEALVDSIGKGFTLGHFGEDPSPDDRVPVLLANKATFDSGEDLVKVYSQPNYSDFDPSGIVLYCFAVFYGMIIGDAGYGLVLLGLTVLLHMKVKSTSDLWIRMRRLSYLLSFSVLFFGFISASYFGISLEPDNVLNKMLLLNFGTKEGQNQVMLVSVIMGMVHISIALAIKFYRMRDLPSLGWIIVMWSAYALLISKMMKGEENPIATYILIAGFVLVVLFTSDAKNPIIRILLGLNGALGVVQLFADVLSYMRLFALGLATMYMCQTFNMLAEMPYKGLPYIGFLPAVLILISGHAINILLGIMGGVVHGLRLNFLEWYRWCFEGDGLAFKAFRKGNSNA